jgi:hypothetical protein
MAVRSLAPEERLRMAGNLLVPPSREYLLWYSIRSPAERPGPTGAAKTLVEPPEPAPPLPAHIGQNRSWLAPVGAH